MKQFSLNGVRFDYPHDWTMEIDSDQSASWSVTLTSPWTAFIQFSYTEDENRPENLANEILNVFQDEYEHLDATAYNGKLGQWMAVGYDIDFTTIDQVVTSKLRVLSFQHGCLALILQYLDQDSDYAAKIMDDLLATLRL